VPHCAVDWALNEIYKVTARVTSVSYEERKVRRPPVDIKVNPNLSQEEVLLSRQHEI